MSGPEPENPNRTTDQREQRQPVEDVHTCHAERPCHTGGKPIPDFSPTEKRLAFYMLLGRMMQEAANGR